MSEPCRFRGAAAGLEFSRVPGREDRVAEVRSCERFDLCTVEDEGLPQKELREDFDVPGCQWRGEHLRDCESG